MRGFSGGLPTITAQPLTLVDPLEQPVGPGDPAYLVRRVCFYCHKDEVTHIDAHCPFDSTLFRPMTPDEYFDYLAATGLFMTGGRMYAGASIGWISRPRK